MLIFIHGAMDRGAGAAQLARRFPDAETVRYDRRGYGRARDKGATDLQGHVDDLVSVAGSAPVVLFGHSYGGLVALCAAACQALDVRAVVTWEVPAPWLGSWPGWELPRRCSSDGELAETFMVSVIGATRWASLPERTKNARRAEGSALRADLDPALCGAAPFDPGQIDVPVTLGVGGASDVRYREAANWFHDRIPDAAIAVIDGLGHGAPLEHAELIAPLIRHSSTNVTAASAQGTKGCHVATF